ncbi:hypothetical protein J1N35_043740 [Gossypium stocksii]|uniref:RNase H type-1 domain-containing protein n=1 Tax=Gossypium stocksii TaxID=47602 RepID=A0A9D3ZFD1_9ROSI|nr:hypothetical protein J1N35_043740 [Gossypium stocksii]
MEVVKVSRCWARQNEAHLGGHTSNIPRLNSTNNPDENWVFLSTDGAVARDFGFAASEGVVRGHDGKWIVGFTRFLGVCSSFEAELCGILDGVLILLNKGYRRAIIMIDNLEVAQNLEDLDLEDSGIAVLRRIQQLLRSEEEWKIKHIPIDQNLVADRLAKFGLNWKSSLQVINKAPKEVLDLLQADSVNNRFMNLM